jgi:hypothetical protein
MMRLEKLGLAAVLALSLVVCVGATSATATTICVGGTITAPCTNGHPGGAFTLVSTTTSLTIHGSSTFNCTNSSITGTAPATLATTVSIPVSLSFSGCTNFGILPFTFTVPANCQAGGATPVRLNMMGNQATAPQAAANLTIPSGCAIGIDVPAASCTLTLSGDQTIGAASGIAWTNGSSTTFSTARLTAALVPTVESSGGTSGCPVPGAHTGTLNGTYRVSSPTPAPGMVINP